jgi:predicted amidophosphoribosyltransferase
MECPSCHSEMPDNSKFCDVCGAALPVCCTSCGAANRVGAKSSDLLASIYGRFTDDFDLREAKTLLAELTA